MYRNKYNCIHIIKTFVIGLKFTISYLPLSLLTKNIISFEKTVYLTLIKLSQIKLSCNNLSHV